MAGQDGASEHPYVPELVERLRRGAISRRQFLRTASLLGVSAATAAALGGCGDGEEEAATEAPAPPATEPEAPKGPNVGGTLRVSMRVRDLTDPAMYVSPEQANIARHMVEPLVRLNQDNVAEPYLAERWEVSEDLKTWTFHLRKDAKWSNFEQEPFNADDVVSNFKRWLDPARGSSNLVRFSALSQSGVEKVDDFTVRLNLDRPDLSVPESLAEYPALILHRKFDEEGGNLPANPIGTGAYKIREYRQGEHTLLERTRDPASASRPSGGAAAATSTESAISITAPTRRPRSPPWWRTGSISAITSTPRRRRWSRNRPSLRFSRRPRRTPASCA